MEKEERKFCFGVAMDEAMISVSKQIFIASKQNL